MTQWGEGYVSDIPYPGGVYREQMPSHLDAVCLVAGVEPVVEPDAPFNYCELGCGVGDTAIIVAAAYPKAKVWGFDFNPGHIAQGSACAARAGLDNLVLAERSFEDLAGSASDEMPPLDYVTLHGVWSWVSPANQAHIVAFLRKCLRPGGVFSVSYNALPGWGDTIGLQHLLLEAGRRTAGGSDARIREATALARRLVDAGGSALRAVEVEKIEKMLAEGHVQYLSHEYLNDYWAPVFHADVVAALAPAKLSYIGSANILENFPQLCVKPEHDALLKTLPASMRQTVQDYFCPRTFRRDVFVRGIRLSPPRKRAQRLDAQRLALIVPARSASCRVKIPMGEATLNEAFYGPALGSIGRGHTSIGELLETAAAGTAPAPEEIVGILIGSGQVLGVCAPADPDALARVRRVNRARIAETIDDGRKDCWLASPVVGSSIRVDVMEMLIYEVVAREPDFSTISLAAIRSGVVALMEGYGMSISRDAADTDAGVNKEIEEFIAEKLPMWQRIGLL